ncbi:hypothetical protein JCM11251_004401 [Rhodosporidiobolus azoricus]
MDLHRPSAAAHSPHHPRTLVPPSPLQSNTRSPAKRAGAPAKTGSRSAYPAALAQTHRSAAFFPTSAFGKVNRSIPSFSANDGFAKRTYFSTSAGLGRDDGWDTEDEAEDEDEEMAYAGRGGESATGAGLDGADSSSDGSFGDAEGVWMMGGRINAGTSGPGGEYGTAAAPSTMAEATAALRALKQSPLATAPKEDYFAFESLYSIALTRAKDLFAFCSEDIAKGMLSLVEAFESRAYKAIDVLDAEKEQLVGEEATARQKKAADLSNRLASLHTQVLQNRQETKTDLSEIREEITSRLSTLSHTYSTQRRKLDASLKKQLAAASSANAGGGGGGAGGVASMLKLAGLDMDEEDLSSGMVGGKKGGGARGRKR